MKSTGSDIDFVIPWVDGNDPAWLAEFSCIASGLDGDKRPSRYRDWANLHYLFRGIEAFTPWVRMVHFVTWGHLPSWLNVNHPKLKIVKHADFIQEKYLPVFSCNPLEVNLHRIPGLSDKFVYLNDDTFLLKNIDSNRFFKDELPRDMFSFNTIGGSPISHILLNDIDVINQHFGKKEVIAKNLSKILRARYGAIELYKTISLMPWPLIPGFTNHHQPQPFLRATFEELWEREPTVLAATTASKVRSVNDVNQYLFRYWQLCKGTFVPIGFGNSYSKLLSCYRDSVEMHDRIVSGKYEMVCINDNINDKNEFDEVKKCVNAALCKTFYAKSQYEL